MKKKTIRLTGFALAMMLSLSPIVPAGSNPFVFTAEAHSGRTDSSGGHRDNKNKSGLGSYHYHCGGYPEAQALPTVMHPAPEVLRLPLRYRKQRLQRPWKL